MMHTPNLDTPIGEMFSDDNFKGFVYDFYQTLPDIEDIPAIGDIYREIFSDEYRYREFLYYCKNNNFSFTHIEGGVSPELTLSLGILQIFRGVVVDQVQSLLHIPKREVYDTMVAEKPPVLRGKSKWEALQAAIYAGIPVNSYGEVVYLISKVSEGYKVYSEESGVHEIDAQGKVLCDTQQEKEKIKQEGKKIKNREQRQEVLKTIQKFRRFQILMHESTIEDENDIRLATVMMQMFEKETGSCWSDIEGDEKEENVYAMRLKSYVFFKLCDLEKQFKILREEDTFSTANIVLVGGTDIED